MQSKGENRSSLRPTSEGADCTWEVSSGRIGKSGLIQNTLAQLHAVSDAVERPSKTGRPWRTRCECYQNPSVMIITFQSTIPASGFKRQVRGLGGTSKRAGLRPSVSATKICKKAMLLGKVIIWVKWPPNVAVFDAAFCYLHAQARQGSFQNPCPSQGAQVWPTLKFVQGAF